MIEQLNDTFNYYEFISHSTFHTKGGTSADFFYCGGAAVLPQPPLDVRAPHPVSNTTHTSLF